MDLELHLAHLIAERRRAKEQEASSKSKGMSSKKEQAAAAAASSKSEQQRSEQRNDTDCDSNRSRLIGLNWSTRLTIILVGTCLLFSTFFALEFLIAKLLSVLIATDAATSVSCLSNKSQTIEPDWNNTGLKCHHRSNPLLTLADFDAAAGASTCRLEATAEQRNRGEEMYIANSRLELNDKRLEFGLIFENELKLTQDEQHYELGSRKWPISAQLRLQRILEAHQAAMPFNPDIWLYSEPAKQMHLLWGNLSRCSLELADLLDRLNGTGGRAKQVRGLERQKLQQLMDSFGRPESGSLLAHPFWLGSYLQCQQLNLERWKLKSRFAAPAGGPLQTRYCVGKVVMNSWPIHSAHETRSGSGSSSGAEAEAEAEGQELVSFKVGLCLPKSCDSLALFKQQQMMMNEEKQQTREMKENPIEAVRKQVELLMRFNFNPNKANGMNLFAANEIKLNDIYCLPLEESRKLGFSAFLLLLSLCLWLSACVLCTWLRWRRLALARAASPGQKSCNCDWLPNLDDRLLEMMAIDVNLERFLLLDSGARQQKQQTDSSAPPQQVNLDVLDSVKHLGCIGVIGAHVFLTYLTLGTAYSHIIEHIGKDMRTMLLLSLNNTVDTFFVISGLLASYLMLQKLHKMDSSAGSTQEVEVANTQKTNTKSTLGHKQLALVRMLLRMVVGRYVRMAPLYFLVFACTKSLATHLGSGPLWDYATNGQSLRGLCRRESWLWPLAFLSNLKPIAHHCVPPAWSLAVDLQFFLLMPLFVLALKRWPRRWSYTLIGLLVCLSSWSTFRDYHSLLEESLVSLADFAKLRLHVFTLLIKHSARGYSATHNRMGPILIGLLGGHLLHHYELRPKRRSQQEYADEDEDEDKRQQQWPHYMRGRCFRWILSAGLLFACAPALVRLREQARSPYPMQQQRQLNSSASKLFRLTAGRLLDTSTEFDGYLTLAGFVLIKPLWSLCNLLLLLRLATDLRPSLLGRLMSLPCWQILSKLNYAILLIHFEFISYEAMSRYSLSPISWPELLCKFCFAYLCSLFAASLLHVLVERPAHKLTSWLLFASASQHQRGYLLLASSTPQEPRAAAAEDDEQR